jgi:hypothetical protein
MSAALASPLWGRSSETEIAGEFTISEAARTALAAFSAGLPGGTSSSVENAYLSYNGFRPFAVKKSVIWI